MASSTSLVRQTVQSYAGILVGGCDLDTLAFSSRLSNLVNQVAIRPLTFKESQASSIPSQCFSEVQANAIIDDFYSAFKLRLNQVDIDLDDVEQRRFVSLALKQILTGLSDAKLKEATRCADTSLSKPLDAVMKLIFLERKFESMFSRLEKNQLHDRIQKYALLRLEEISIESYPQIIETLKVEFPNMDVIDLEMAFRKALFFSRPNAEFHALYTVFMTPDSFHYIALRKTLLTRFEKVREPIRRIIDEFERANSERFQSLQKKDETKKAYLKKRLELGLTTPPGYLSEETCVALDDGDKQELHAEKNNYRSQIETCHRSYTVFRESAAKLRAPDCIKFLPCMKLPEEKIRKIADQVAAFYSELGRPLGEENKSERADALHKIELQYKSLLKYIYPT